MYTRVEVLKLSGKNDSNMVPYISSGIYNDVSIKCLCVTLRVVVTLFQGKSTLYFHCFIVMKLESFLHV